MNSTQDITCGGELVVLGTRLLSGSAHGCCLLNLREGEEQKEVLEAKDDEEKESEVDGEVVASLARSQIGTSCFRAGLRRCRRKCTQK